MIAEDRSLTVIRRTPCRMTNLECRRLRTSEFSLPHSHFASAPSGRNTSATRSSGGLWRFHSFKCRINGCEALHDAADPELAPYGPDLEPADIILARDLGCCPRLAWDGPLARKSGAVHSTAGAVHAAVFLAFCLTGGGGRAGS